MLKHLLLAAASLLAAGLAAADASYEVQSPLDARTPSNMPRLQPLDSENQASQPTAFLVDTTLDGIRILIMLNEPDDPDKIRNDVEIFFQVSDKLPSAAYYQFFTSLKGPLPPPVKEKDAAFLAEIGLPPECDRHFDAYYYNDTVKGFPFLKAHASKVTKPMPHEWHAELFLPWSGLAEILPFDPVTGKGKTWKFTVARNRDNQYSIWQGKLHQPATWGTLKFNDFANKEREAVFQAIKKRLCANTPPPFESFLYTEESRRTAAKALDALRAEVKAEPGAAPDLWQRFQPRLNLTAFPGFPRKGTIPGWTVRSIATGRELTPGKQGFGVYDERGKLIQKEPKAFWLTSTRGEPGKDAGLRMEYVFGSDSIGDVLVTGLQIGTPYGQIPSISTDLLLNDKKIQTVQIPGLPCDVVIGKVKKGDVLRLEFRTGETAPAVYFSPSFRVQEYRFGLRPLPPGERNSADLRKPRLLIDRNGMPGAHMLARHQNQTMAILREQPELIFAGGDLSDGLGFDAGFQTRVLDRWNTGDMGMVGSPNPVILWHLLYGALDRIPLRVVVLQPEIYGNSIVARDQVKAMLDVIRAKAPNAKVVLVGTLPGRADKTPENQAARRACNAQWKTLADGKTVWFIDPIPAFAGANGVIRKELHGEIYPTKEGYRTWLDLVLPEVERLLPPKKK